MGWSRTYLKRNRIKKSQIWSHLIRQFFSSFLYLPLLKLNKFIERLARSIGGLSNLFGIDCFNKNNKNPKIKLQNII